MLIIKAMFEEHFFKQDILVSVYYHCTSTRLFYIPEVWQDAEFSASVLSRTVYLQRYWHNRIFVWIALIATICLAPGQSLILCASQFVCALCIARLTPDNFFVAKKIDLFLSVNRVWIVLKVRMSS